MMLIRILHSDVRWSFFCQSEQTFLDVGLFVFFSFGETITTTRSSYSIKHNNVSSSTLSR